MKVANISGVQSGRIFPSVPGWDLTETLFPGREGDSIGSVALDAWLSNGGDIEFQWTGRNFSADPEVLNAVVKDAYSRGIKLFDSPKVRVASDPVPGSVMEVEGTTYFNGLATNETAFKTVETPNGLFDGHAFAFPDGMIPPLKESGLSNHIGASCLAFDDEGTLLLTVTTAASAVAGGKIAPSGAGSCEVDDFPSGGGSAVAAATRRMETELREETGLLSHADMETRVVAFRRFVERGGKPDFAGMVRLKGVFSQLSGPLSAAETEFTAGFVTLNARKLGYEGLHAWAIEMMPRLGTSLLADLDILFAEARRPGSELWEFLGLR